MAQGIRSSQSSGGPSLSRAAALDPVLGFCNSLLLSLLGLFLSLAFIVDFSYAQNITKLENGLPIRYTITNVSSWPALGGAFFFGSTTPIGQAIGGPGLLITNNSFDQNGLAYLSSPIPKASLFGGFDQDIGFLIDENRPASGSQGDGVAWLFQPPGSPPSGILANGQPAIQMYPPDGTAQIPGAVEVHVGTNGQASANEPQGSDFIAVYKNRDVNYNNAACKLEVAKGTFVGKPVGVRTSYGYSAATDGTLILWYKTPTRPYPIQPDLTCNNVPMPNVTGQDVFFSIMGSTAAAQANRHIMTYFFTDYCAGDFSGYSGADGGFCFCGPDFQPNTASNGCVPRQVGPTTSGLVPTSTVSPPLPPSTSSGLSTGAIAGIAVGAIAGVGLIGAGLFFTMRNKKKEKRDASIESDIKVVPPVDRGLPGAGAVAAVPVVAASAAAVSNEVMPPQNGTMAPSNYTLAPNNSNGTAYVPAATTTAAAATVALPAISEIQSAGDFMARPKPAVIELPVTSVDVSSGIATDATALGTNTPEVGPATIADIQAKFLLSPPEDSSSLATAVGAPAPAEVSKASPTLVASTETAIASSTDRSVSASSVQSQGSVSPVVPTASKLMVPSSEVTIDYNHKLGEGGFGVVYEGKLRGSVKVAVKTFRGQIDAKTGAAFAKEIQTWEGLVQRNVLPLMAFCVDPPLMVTDLIEEGNLRQYLDTRNWDQTLGRRFLLDVATGMNYLHSLGILHGDLKSLNVLIDGSRAVITDFGLAKMRSAVSRTACSTDGGLAGTPGFVAPEVLMGDGLKKPADVYGWAMVCYEVLSKGKYPFEEVGNAAAIIYKLAIEKTRPARPEGVDDAAWALVEKAWAQDPIVRPTFEALMNDWAQVL